MAVHDFTSQRLFVDAPLQAGAKIAIADEQANYLLNVLRMAEGAEILIFNGRDGEWRASIAAVKKRSCMLEVSELVRAQLGGPDIDYVFAPLKRSRLDYMVQKAVEMGVARLRPVITHRTIAERVNLDRMRANVIEAAEQCGVLRVPETLEPRKLEQVIAGWDATRRLVLADEEAAVASPLAVLNALPAAPVGAVIIGPRGRVRCCRARAVGIQPYVVRVSLGPRIMRADTAAVAVLTLVNAVLGDWR